MIADRLHLVLKINLSGLPAFPWERQGLAGWAAGAGWKLAFICGQILSFCLGLLLLCLHMKLLSEVHLAFLCEAWHLNLGVVLPQIPKLKSFFMTLFGWITFPTSVVGIKYCCLVWLTLLAFCIYIQILEPDRAVNLNTCFRNVWTQPFAIKRYTMWN